MYFGVPVVAQQKLISLASMRTKVQCLASLIGLRTRHCCELWCRSQTRLRPGVAVAAVQASSYSSDLTSSMETSICRRCGPKKTKDTHTHTHKNHKYFILHISIQTRYISSAPETHDAHDYHVRQHRPSQKQKQKNPLYYLNY